MKCEIKTKNNMNYMLDLLHMLTADAEMTSLTKMICICKQ